MARMAWHKRFHREAMEATRNLTLEEMGAFVRLTDAIYEMEGRLPDNERLVAGFLGSTVRVWRRLRSRLVELGRLYVADGLLRSVETDEGLTAMVKAYAQRREAGEHSANVRRTFADHSANIQPNFAAIPSEINGLVPTAAQREPGRLKTQDKDSESPLTPPPFVTETGAESPSTPPQEGRPLKAKAKPDKRGTRLPSDFVPDIAYAVSKGLPTPVAEEEAEKFINWCRAASGSKALAVDWSSKWRTWVLHALPEYRERTNREARALARYGTPASRASAALDYIRDPVTGSIPG